MLTHENSPLFRVFISSTFSDFKTERDYLDEFVFHKIRQYCESRGARFQHVDLRWGISPNAAHEMRVAELCEQELRRCQFESPRPNFVVLSGDRYGWCPFPRKISNKDWHEILNNTSELEAIILCSLFLPDYNTDPVEYIYDPRRGDLIPAASTILAAASLKAFSNDIERRMKYEASITHQEIWLGALQKEADVDHVFLFSRRFLDLPSLMTDEKVALLADYASDGKLDQSKYDRQQILRQSLEAKLPESSRFSIESSWQDWPHNSTIKELGKRLEQHLIRVISQEIDARNTERSLKKKTNIFADEISHILQATVPRRELLTAIHNIVDLEPGRPLFVIGPSGTGKSTLLAMFAHGKREEGVEVLWTSIGVTGGERDLTASLNRLVESLSYTLGVPYIEAEDAGSVATEFARLLNTASSQRIYVIFDGVDQLDSRDRARELWWIPTRTSEKISLIISAAIEQDNVSLLARSVMTRTQPANRLTIGELTPELSLKVVDEWLQYKGRLISGEQRVCVLEALSHNSSPIYARLLAHQLESRTSFASTIRFPATVRKVFQVICDSWSGNGEHGEIFVKTVLGFLAIARDGLSEDEILDLINRNEIVLTETWTRFAHAPPRPQLPFAVWSRFRNDLEPFLSESTKQRLLVLFHSQIRQAVKDWALPTLESQCRSHALLGKYFLDRGLISSKVNSAKVLTIRFLSEAAYHAVESASPEVIRFMISKEVLSAFDSFLGEGFTQSLLENCCRVLTQNPILDTELIKSLALKYINRYEQISAWRSERHGIAEYIYQGNLPAAIALIRTQGEGQQSVSYFTAAEILDSLGNTDAAEMCRQNARSIRTVLTDLDGVKRSILESLLEPTAFSKLEQFNANVNKRNETRKRNNPLQLWIVSLLVAITNFLLAIPYTAMNVSGALIPLMIFNPDAVGPILFLFITILFVTFLVMLPVIGIVRVMMPAVIISQVNDLSMKPSSRDWPICLICYLLGPFNNAVRRAVLKDVCLQTLVDSAIHSHEVTNSARLLVHASNVMTWSDGSIASSLMNASATRQRQIIRSLGLVAENDDWGIPLLLAISKIRRTPETTQVMMLQIEFLPIYLDKLRKQHKSYSWWIWRKKSLAPPELSILLNEFPRTIRAELLLQPKSKGQAHERLTKYIFVDIPIRYWWMFHGTHWLEKCLMIPPLIVGIITLRFMLPGLFSNLNFLWLGPIFLASYALVLTTGSAMCRWTTRQNQEKIDRLNGDLRWRNITFRSKTPPWKWVDWFPVTYGIFLINLLTARNANTLSTRKDYGATLDQDLERYSEQWGVLVTRYDKSMSAQTRSIAPPLCAFLGPDGIADLVLARLILLRGWRAAVNGPAFPPEVWERVTKLLIRSEWLGIQAETIVEVLSIPAAVKVILKDQSISHNSPKLDNNPRIDLDERLIANSQRINDLRPQLLHRAIVSGAALLVSTGAVMPISREIIQHVDQREMPEFWVLMWVTINFSLVGYYLPNTIHWWPRFLCGAIAVIFIFIAILEFSGGVVVGQVSTPWGTVEDRGWLFSVVNAAVIPLMFLAPWVVATFRGSLLLNPSPSRLLLQKCLGLFMLPLFCLLISLYLVLPAVCWQGLEKVIVELLQYMSQDRRLNTIP